MIHHKESIMIATAYFVFLGVAIAAATKSTIMHRTLGSSVVDQKGMLFDVFTATVMMLSGILFLEYMIL